MKRPENSGEEASLSLIADKRAGEYFAKESAALRAKLHEMDLDPVVAKAIDDFFDRFTRIYLGDDE